MAKLSAKTRKKLKSNQFALPGRKYPVEDKAHAANAKARATQQRERGNLSDAQYRRVMTKANKELAK